MPQTPPRKHPIVSPYFSPQNKAADAPTIDHFQERLIQLKPCLIQETVADDPWKLLVAVTLLNKTAGKLALPVFWQIMATWSTAWALSQATESDLVTLIRPLGTQNIRAKRLISLSRAYLQDPPVATRRAPRAKYPPTPISHLPGAGAYALDSYRIFCSGPASEEWKDVNPTDKELIRYLKWKWAAMEIKQWSPETGVIGTADLPYIAGLVSDLELHATKNKGVSI
ncbi:DNA glycosylase [Mycena crocata]|nr:DNA glycosylase [Mycena crocata]